MSPLAGQAGSYARVHGKAPDRYVEDVDLYMNNNLSESTVRAAVIGRKNWVFSANDAGAEQAQFPPDVQTFWFHQRCYRSKATDRSRVPSKTGIEFTDIRTRQRSVNHCVCGGGFWAMTPASGLVYAPFPRMPYGIDAPRFLCLGWAERGPAERGTRFGKADKGAEVQVREPAAPCRRDNRWKPPCAGGDRTQGWHRALFEDSDWHFSFLPRAGPRRMGRLTFRRTCERWCRPGRPALTPSGQNLEAVPMSVEGTNAPDAKRTTRFGYTVGILVVTV